MSYELVMECPRVRIGRVIGKGGETFRALQAYTGATITIDQSGDPTKITIQGSPKNVRDAADIISDIIRGSFKGFALLRHTARVMERARFGNTTGQRPPQVIYVPNYGFAPASQVEALKRRVAAMGGAEPSAESSHAMWPPPPQARMTGQDALYDQLALDPMYAGAADGGWFPPPPPPPPRRQPVDRTSTQASTFPPRNHAAARAHPAYPAPASLSVHQPSGGYDYMLPPPAPADPRLHALYSTVPMHDPATAAYLADPLAGAAALQSYGLDVSPDSLHPGGLGGYRQRPHAPSLLPQGGPSVEERLMWLAARQPGAGWHAQVDAPVGFPPSEGRLGSAPASASPSEPRPSLPHGYADSAPAAFLDSVVDPSGGSLDALERDQQEAELITLMENAWPRGLAAADDGRDNPAAHSYGSGPTSADLGGR